MPEGDRANSMERSKAVWVFFLWLLVPLAIIQIFSQLSGQSFSLEKLLLRLGFVLGIFSLAWSLERLLSKHALLNRLTIFLVLVASAAIYFRSQSTFAAWTLSISGGAALIKLASWLSADLPTWKRVIVKIVLAGIAGAACVAVLQIEERFSEEEFFAAIQMCVMGLIWLTILLAYQRWSGLKGGSAARGKVKRLSVVIGLAVFCALGLFFVLTSYQNSFFPKEAPVFEGITNATPFICGKTTPGAADYRGSDVFERLIALVEANPHKEVPEYGLLALATNDGAWTAQFHDELLKEAGQMLFTQRENSVKYGQCLASQRVYYYWRIADKYPELFNSGERQGIARWFAAINRRALSVGWVDWFYAVAFSKFPSGPYENQECGAGLLAILEVSGLADPELAPDNREFLAKNPRGWLERFRNTDDTYNYQIEWLRNAWYQYLYWKQVDLLNLEHSFEWFLLQALPDGAPLRYNHYAAGSAAQVGYWASTLSLAGPDEPPRLVSFFEQNSKEAALWLSGRAADYMGAQDLFLGALPGIERSSELIGSSSRLGSCLMFGNSGLPNQVGPLAPDKLVFRNGWQKDSLYLLMNLRFTGWHRYKATNSIVLIYQNAPIVSEIHLGEPFSWLPVGRSLLRDKRTPRENLNGLLVQRTGLSSVIYVLTGVGSRWAQDPPFYVEIERFETGVELDQSRTILSGWRGWRQARGILFSHQGPVVIVDQVEGPKSEKAAVSWHFAGELHRQGEGRYRLGEGQGAVEVLFTRYDAPLAQAEISETWLEARGYTGLIYEPRQPGGFSLLTIVLPAGWVGAQARLTQDALGPVLRLTRNGEQIDFRLEGYLDSP